MSRLGRNLTTGSPDFECGGSKCVRYGSYPSLLATTAPLARSALLAELAARILRISVSHPVRVAIDGVDGSGKTTLANELIEPIKGHGREVIRASIDGFHRPRKERLRRGEYSPEGYYYDSFDYEAIWSNVLRPLGPGGNRAFRPAVFDYRRDDAVAVAPYVATADAVLVFY